MELTKKIKEEILQNLNNCLLDFEDTYEVEVIQVRVSTNNLSLKEMVLVGDKYEFGKEFHSVKHRVEIGTTLYYSYYLPIRLSFKSKNVFKVGSGIRTDNIKKDFLEDIKVFIQRLDLSLVDLDFYIDYSDSDFERSFVNSSKEFYYRTHISLSIVNKDIYKAEFNISKV